MAKSGNYSKLALGKEEAENKPISYLQRCKTSFSLFSNHMKTSFGTLKDSPRELYLAFILYGLSNYSYFATTQIFVIYLHANFGISDMEAGTAYGIWGAAITLWGFLTSCISDTLGVRKSLIVGSILCCLAYVCIALTSSSLILLTVFYTLMPIGFSMQISMLTVSVKQSTNEINRGFAFGCFYASMNIAALFAGPMVDLANYLIPSQDGSSGVYWTGNRLVLLTAAFMNFLSLLVVLVYMPIIADSNNNHRSHIPSVNEEDSSVHNTGLHRQEEDEERLEEALDNIKQRIDSFQVKQQQRQGTDYHDNDGHLNKSSKLHSNNNNTHLSPPLSSSSSSSTHSSSSMFVILLRLLYSATFWRFVIFCLCLINLKMIFRHIDATLPTYLLRCFGSSYPRGMILSINPFLIIFLAPIVAAMTSSWPHYTMIKYGGWISALSPFCLSFSTSTFAVIMFSVLLSIGEALWSPRLNDYTMSIAPKGMEATFSAMAQAPLFAAKIPVGMISGYLLTKYLPDDGQQHDVTKDGEMLWLTIGLLTISSPLCITLFEACIREPVTITSKGINGEVGNDSEDIVVDEEEASTAYNSKSRVPSTIDELDEKTSNVEMTKMVIFVESEEHAKNQRIIKPYL